MKRRASGILLHISSLPSPFGIGDMGPWAYKFADFLCETKQNYWQILPLNPTESVHHHSPYHSTSAFASNPLLLSLELMMDNGLIAKKELDSSLKFPDAQVDYAAVEAYKERLFDRAYETFKTNRKNRQYQYEAFCSQNADWLQDFALFMALKAHFRGKTWSEWPHELRDREPGALQSMTNELAEHIERIKFLQYLFHEQWVRLRRYCNEKGIQIIGDIPIYVQYDSADLWVNPQLFKLDDARRPSVVAGVPPDYFSETGQLWGNPIYRWDALRKTGFSWWIQRVKRNLDMFDVVRIDHFRGLIAYWEVPATENTAMNGKWIEVPAQDFFNALFRKLPYARLIAEDLGVITPDVREVMNHFEFPGMKLLLFAFGPDLPTNPYAPHNLVKNCIVYTGTHDNNTTRGWFTNEAPVEDKERLSRYLGRKISEKDVHWELVRLAMMSVADTAIFPMQDILGLGGEARMNRPAKTEGNWLWRLSPQYLTDSVRKRLVEATQLYGRA